MQAKLHREDQGVSIKVSFTGICEKCEVEEEDNVNVRALGIMSERKDLQKL